jgi:hypothetical protein
MKAYITEVEGNCGLNPNSDNKFFFVIADKKKVK